MQKRKISINKPKAKKQKLIKTNKENIIINNFKSKLTPEEVINFIDGVQKMSALKSTSKSKLISLKIPEGLLRLFRIKCESHKIPYQTQIKVLMELWLKQK